MKRVFLTLTLGLAFALAGCITQQYDSQGNPIGRAALERELVTDTGGRIIARPTHLIPPDRMIINGNTPTERGIRLLGGEGVSRDKAPTTYAKSQEWMAKYVAEEDEIYIKPALNTDLKQRVIYGIVYLRAVDEDTGREIPGGYVNVNMAMLSQGLVRTRDLREIEDAGLRERMQAAEDYARRERLGLWSGDP